MPMGAELGLQEPLLEEELEWVEEEEGRGGLTRCDSA